MTPVGVLAVQGAFLEHEQTLSRLGAEWFEIRQKSDLNRPMGGLILPGGESTVMGKLLRGLAMLKPIREKIKDGLPVLGTCAGLILLAKRIEGGEPPHLATMDVAVRRNGYGRQLGSFSARGFCAGIGEIPMVFIRAPYIEEAWGGAEILAEVDGRAVAARQGNQLVTAFHPELTDDDRVHRAFLDMIEANG